jgi:hypothetical protein
MKVLLTNDEKDALQQEQAGMGGFQSLLEKLQTQLNPAGELVPDRDDLEKIPRYAFDYGNGGWEELLKQIFQRPLGTNLGR